MTTLDPDDDSAPRASRPRHIVDRARDYATLETQGLTAAQIARRRRKSEGYVSIVLRLGRALRTLSAEEVDVLRCERVTWKVAQRVVRKTTSNDAILRQLRYAVGGFSSLTIDRRKLRGGRRGARAAGPSVGPSSDPPGATTWYADAAWAARDPLGYLDAYRTFLARLHQQVGRELRAALAARAAASPADPAPRIPLTGQSLRHLMRQASETRRGPASGARVDVDGDVARRELVALDAFFRALSGSADPEADAPDPTDALARASDVGVGASEDRDG